MCVHCACVRVRVVCVCVRVRGQCVRVCVAAGARGCERVNGALGCRLGVAARVKLGVLLPVLSAVLEPGSPRSSGLHGVQGWNRGYHRVRRGSVRLRLPYALGIGPFP